MELSTQGDNKKRVAHSSQMYLFVDNSLRVDLQYVTR
jgi:hypothetical protein